VGRLNANKDPLTVLEGFARFTATHPQATLTFVYGTSDLEAALRAAVQRTAGAARVTLAGAVPHGTLESVYAAADIFVLGSRREGSGYAALEAMACGVVPVLTNIPAFRGLTDDGRVGALWEPGDPASLADALARVADAPLDPQRERCRRRFEERFSWTAIGSRAAEIYRECSAR
jgi:glycosyltransferase involved in cell wall biosynthesis